MKGCPVQEDELFKLFLSTEVILRKAKEYILSISEQGVAVVTSHGRDVKVDADKEMDLFIINGVKKLKNIKILTEESGLITPEEEDDEFIWIIDPLDGSLNYSRGIPLCCISISLWSGDNPIFGFVYDFNRNELFKGFVGKGAWLNEKPITVGEVKEKKQAILCTGLPISTDFSEKALHEFTSELAAYKKIRLLGTAALSLAYVASGRVDVYKENNIKIWDVAAGIALVRSAGGFVNSTYNDYAKYTTYTYASNTYLSES